MTHIPPLHATHLTGTMNGLREQITLANGNYEKKKSPRAAMFLRLAGIARHESFTCQKAIPPSRVPPAKRQSVLAGRATLCFLKKRMRS